MEPEELFEDDLDLGGEAEDWDAELSVDPDEDSLGLDWDESDTQSVARDLGIVTSEL
jgi:hypothetical protein